MHCVLLSALHHSPLILPSPIISVLPRHPDVQVPVVRRVALAAGLDVVGQVAEKAPRGVSHASETF